MDRLAEAERRLGHRFDDRGLLEQALRHASSADDRLQSNERLEFLGDAVLGIVVCRELYNRFPDLLEGELTKIKSNVVSRRVCAEIAEELGIGRLLQLGKGMDGRGEMPPSLLAAVLESVIGAMYEDAGFERTSKFILDLLETRIDHAAKLGHQQNFKSVLQQVFQRKGLGAPNYQVLDERGPDHAKCFKVSVAAAGRRFGGCWGPNKKQAEQQAALTALLDLELASSDAAGDIHLAEACWNDGAVPHAILHAATAALGGPPPPETASSAAKPGQEPIQAPSQEPAEEPGEDPDTHHDALDPDADQVATAESGTGRGVDVETGTPPE